MSDFLDRISVLHSNSLLTYLDGTYGNNEIRKKKGSRKRSQETPKQFKIWALLNENIRRKVHTVPQMGRHLI